MVFHHLPGWMCQTQPAIAPLTPLQRLVAILITFFLLHIADAPNNGSSITAAKALKSLWDTLMTATKNHRNINIFVDQFNCECIIGLRLQQQFICLAIITPIEFPFIIQPMLISRCCCMRTVLSLHRLLMLRQGLCAATTSLLQGKCKWPLLLHILQLLL